MKKNQDKYKKYLTKEGHLDKMSTSIFLGFQKKFWKILNDGKNIAYRNPNQADFSDKNTFPIKYCTATEGSGQGVFQLSTQDRAFTLKADNDDEKNEWIKAVTYLKKELHRNKKKKNEPSPTQTTMATQDEKKIPQATPNPKIKKTETSTSLKFPPSPTKSHTPEDLGVEVNDKSIIDDFLKYMPQKFLKYHTLLVHLKTKKQGMLMNSLKDDTYVLVSPKSLYPQVHISDENLTNRSIPPWLDINKFYKISGGKAKIKQIVRVSKILSIEPSSTECSFKINTGELIFQFFTDTSIEMECVCSCLENAMINAKQVGENGEIKKKNYDKIIDAHQTQIQNFKSMAREILQEFIPDAKVHKYSPQILIKFMENIIYFLQEFIQILQKKSKNKNHVILDMLIIFHEEVKIQVKLTWDSSSLTIKPVNVLDILRCLSEYHKVVQPFIKSAEFLEGMKQLSKIYVRASWKSFQTIIRSIVDQQKKDNYYQDQFSTYLQTNGVTDLFKFIYDVFELAHPHWKNKIHLHNVNRLMQRALQVFINQLRSTLNEEVIPEKQMVALANNYFRFSECVNEFYSEKFAPQLAEKTKDAYDKIVNNYKQLSMIVIDKLSSNVNLELESYCEGNSLLTIKTQVIIKILVVYHQNYQKLIHLAFIKKIHEKFVNMTHIRVLDMLIFDLKKKKRPAIKDLVKYIGLFKAALIDIFQEMSKTHHLFTKKMQQIEQILTFDLYADIQAIINEVSQPLRSKYLRVMEFRQDFHQGSALYKIIMNSNDVPRMKKTVNKFRKHSQDISSQNRQKSLTRQYFDDQDDEKSQKSNSSRISGKDKLISEGFLFKGKRNQKVWDKEYFRLKSGFLYIFENESSERCRNSIDLKTMLKIDVGNPEKPSFILCYKNLGKEKQIKIKCENLQLRDRWISSLQLQKRRLQNQKQIKKKAIKLKETGRKKNQLIIDYQQIEKGKDYFSYSDPVKQVQKL